LTYRHLMLDLETWGTSAGCAIRSIGAVFFNLGDSQLGPTYYANVDWLSCHAAGLRYDGVTVAWWGEQPPEAHAALAVDQLPLLMALDGLSQFVEQYGVPEELSVWSHGATFDIPITEYAMRAVGRSAPWKFWNCRDTRTMIWLGAERGITVEVEHVGLHHHALDDARTQALRMIELHRRLHGQPDQPALSPRAVDQGRS
jgi:hypothetical protein